MLKEDIEKHIGKKVKIRLAPTGAMTDGMSFTGTLMKITDGEYAIMAEEGNFFFINETIGKVHYVSFRSNHLTDCEPVNENDADYTSER